MTDKLQLAVNHALQINSAISESAMVRARMGLLNTGMGLDAKRANAWCEYGFKEELNFNDLYKLYRRGGIAHGAVNKLVGTCWLTNPEIIEGDLATPLQANSGALIGESFRERECRLEKAAKDRFTPGDNDYAWIADFTDSQAVIIKNGGDAQVYGYKSEGGKITFSDTGTAVTRQESWVSIIANKVKSLFTPQDSPATNSNNTEGDMPLTKEEMEQIGSMIGEALATNTEKALKPLSDKVDALQANHKTLSDTLTANSRAEEVTKRAEVAKIHGEIVANVLSGEALDAMFKSLGKAAPLGTNSAQTQTETGAPDPATYFGGAK
ncbi:hypothetical protein B7R74_12535 [Yersinia pseudotuberculosis]|uniref:hypothetical protein n=1 Tax=Yersinia pseudotuberculosis TaxID=633 RepID=UPI000D0B6D6D|nr:hypothetical protein [Yersinia pseudotuberculosis]PSH19836.1 hypothetical protein B7R74_12535 [Yersinia pseudotuberculosis]